MNPAHGDELSVPRWFHKNFYEAIRSYGSGTGRAPAVTVVEHNGKLTIQLTYGKLLTRCCKIAYWLLTKTFRSRQDTFSLKCGDRVALAYTQNDPINFVCAFYGCLLAELVPIPVDPPIHRGDYVTKETGNLLRSLGVRVCLTTEVLSKCLPLAWDGGSANYGWTGLHWTSTEHLPRPHRYWSPSPHFTPDSTSYIEVTSGKDGVGTRGVNITHKSVLQHCQSVSCALGHSEGETVICLLETRRGPGLWHAVLNGILCGMHIIVVAKPVADSNPTCWLHLVSKYRASIAFVTSRDLERCLMSEGVPSTADPPPINLSTLRLLVVCDAANPWSFPVFDLFIDAFTDRGLSPEVVCPTAASPETLTVSVKRPKVTKQRCRSEINIGKISLLAEASTRRRSSSDKFQMELHCGEVLPGSSVAVVQLEDRPELCSLNEIGEICVASEATASSYLTASTSPQDHTSDTFGVVPLSRDYGGPVSVLKYTRSGLIGFLREDGLVFVCGSVGGLLTVGGRRHNADDVVATVAAAQGGGRWTSLRSHIAVFAVGSNPDDGKLVVLASQHPDWDCDKSLRWLLKVLRAVDCLHHVSAYCVALVPDGHLSKNGAGEVNTMEAKRRFLEGSLHPANLLLYNPKLGNADIQSGSIGSNKSSQSGWSGRKFLPSKEGPRLCFTEDDESDPIYKSDFLMKMLHWRSTATSDEVALTQMNGRSSSVHSVTWSQLFRAAGALAALVLERAVITPCDTRVAVIFQPGVQLVAAFYACLYIGAVPIVIKPPHPEKATSFITVQKAIAASRSSVILADHTTAKILKVKALKENSRRKRFMWPIIVKAEETAKKPPPPVCNHTDPSELAYVDFNLSSTGRLTGIEMSHSSTVRLCRSLKSACELYSLRPVVLCLEPYSGLGLALWCLVSVFSGYHSILVPPAELESNPSLWLYTISQYAARDTFCSYDVMEYCTDHLRTCVELKGVTLKSVRWCIALGTNGRPRYNTLTNFARTFAPMGLKLTAVATSFGCRANVAISVQNASNREPLKIYVDKKALRNDRVRLVERGQPESECLVESGKIMPGVKVAVVNTETRELCSKYQVGEIWVSSEHNPRNYIPRRIHSRDSTTGIPDIEDPLNMTLEEDGRTYARTGYLGFVLELEMNLHGTPPVTPESSGEDTERLFHPIVEGPQNAVFIVGALDEIIMFKGLRYHHIFNRY